MQLTTDQAQARIQRCLDKMGLPKRNTFNTNKTDRDAILIARYGDDSVALIYEWYVPESYDDDDLSSTGYKLEPVLGYTRRSTQIHANNVDELLGRLNEIFAG